MKPYRTPWTTDFEEVETEELAVGGWDGVVDWLADFGGNIIFFRGGDDRFGHPIPCGVLTRQLDDADGSMSFFAPLADASERRPYPGRQWKIFLSQVKSISYLHDYWT